MCVGTVANPLTRPARWDRSRDQIHNAFLAALAVVGLLLVDLASES